MVYNVEAAAETLRRNHGTPHLERAKWPDPALDPPERPEPAHARLGAIHHRVPAARN
jgi:hypothetical protein